MTPEIEQTATDCPWIVRHDSNGVCLVEFDGGVRGTMGISGATQLADLIEERASRADAPVLVLSVGILHAELREILEMANGRPIGDWSPWTRAIAALENYPSASIAAVPDQATGGGLELILAADIRVATAEARFGALECRIGLIPGAGGTQRLPLLVGPANAALLCFLGETISGNEAFRLGLVQLVHEEAVSRALELAHRMSQRGSSVLRAVKRSMVAARLRNQDGFRVEGQSFLDLVCRPETKATISEWIREQDAGNSPARQQSWLT